MVTFREAVEGAATLALCTVLDNIAAAAALLGDAAQPFPVGTRLELFAYALRNVCNREGDDPSEVTPPFSGGQCNTIRYTVLGDKTETFDGNQQSVTLGRNYGTYNGPITNIEVFQRVDAVANGLSASAGVRITHGGQAPGSPSVPGQRTYVDDQTFPDARHVSLSVSNLRVIVAGGVGGQPVPPGGDNCGNPPPIIPSPPPGFNQVTNNVTYQNNDGLDITVPVGFAFFNAFFNADFQLEIPFTLSFSPEFTLSGTINLNSGDVNFNFRTTVGGGDGNSPPPPPSPVDREPRPTDFDFEQSPPPPPSEPEFEDVEEPEQPATEKVIRGVIVTVVESDDLGRSVVFQEGGNPDIYPPDLGMVQFQIRVGNSTSWTNNQRVLNKRAFIPCDWQGGAIDVAGTPRPGVDWFLTPVYGKSNLQLVGGG